MVNQARASVLAIQKNMEISKVALTVIRDPGQTQQPRVFQWFEPARVSLISRRRLLISSIASSCAYKKAQVNLLGMHN